MRKYLYLSAVCVCMALCFVGCSKDDDEPGGKGAMYEVTIEQSGDFRSFIKSVVVVANGTQLKDGATGESLASPVILSDEELAVEKVTLSTTGKAIEFAVSGFLFLFLKIFFGFFSYIKFHLFRLIGFLQ
mgnify:CR=1 FL=1